MKCKLFFAAALVLLVAGCRPEGQPSAPATQGESAAAYVELNDANFARQVLDGRQPAMVDFFATWCGPCRQMAPVVEELARDFQGRAIVGKVDVDQNRVTAGGYNIRFIPAFLFFKNGQVVDQVVGPASKQDLAGRLEALLEQ